MSRVRHFAPLFLTTALTLTLAAESRAADVGELFDPSAIAANICGGAVAGDSANAFLQVASARDAAAPTEHPPLWEGLGSHTFPVTTAVPAAQAYFDQGLRLAYGFNHGEAIRAFRAAQAVDPGCAMCAWGEALALGPNINLPMAPEANGPALAALGRAQALAAGTSAKEHALIDALAARYSGDPAAERAALDAAYARAMADVHARFPDDPDVAVLYAEAAMDTTPWDYWLPDRVTPKGAMAGAVAAVESVLTSGTDHAGAIHYYIHVMELVGPEKAEPYADRLAALMPSAGHIVHMPSHIYFRVGRYKDSLSANVAAVEADERFMAQAEADPIYRIGYYPHNIHFALESAAMAGDGGTAIAMAEKLAASIPTDILGQIPMAQPIAAAVLFTHVRFSAADTILALPQPDASLPYLRGLWHYAQGEAHALRGDAAKAAAEADSIAQLAATADLSSLTGNAIPADRVLRVAELVVRGRAAAAAERWTDAVGHFTQAAAAQDALPYMEPAYWYYPVRQSLGIALLNAGKPGEATDVLRQALIETPNNARVLFALKEAAAALGDDLGTREYGGLFAKAWAGGAPPDLGRL